uniref:FUN14 domain-containing protein 2 n=1 Tax=Oncorhynchus mykiss TaxID=8022 RepID=A0A8C7THW2_ONCMY
MAEKKKDKSEEVVEYLLDKSEEVVDYAKKQRWWNKVFGKNSGPVAEKYDVATQLAIGGVSGWCAGYLFQKVGKLAASAVGGGFFLLQIANHTGYIKVDWKRVERDVNKAKKQLKLNTEKPSKEVRTKVDEVDTNRIVHIHSVIILRRSDKRKDRVEISPEQLSSAATEAEISFVKHVSFMKKTNLCLLVVSCRRSV